jgi:hypothetical protein
LHTTAHPARGIRHLAIACYTRTGRSDRSGVFLFALTCALRRARSRSRYDFALAGNTAVELAERLVEDFIEIAGTAAGSGRYVGRAVGRPGIDAPCARALSATGARGRSIAGLSAGRALGPLPRIGTLRAALR